ncbi:MAG: DUF2804 domain-containing protein [Parvibaculum sp.]|uniref:DUF2804 domain-containing protein n=1 Tax=Parvibaculum sp. TaxID=2024848 RepID=UPI003C74B0A8
MQHEMTVGELLDDRGQLVEAGWARSEKRRYRRDAIRAPWFRIKEWDYYCVLADDYGIALTIADNAYMGLLSVSWLDFTKPDTITDSVILPFTKGRMKLPESADAGDIVQQHPKMSLAFQHRPGGRSLSVDCPGFARGRGLKGEIRLDQPDMDRMVIATPFRKVPRAFYYNQKINCMPASGEIEFDGKRHIFEPASAMGILDWGRGVWTYDNTWYWGSASGFVDGHPFGFNIGYGFGDTSAATENMVFLDGKAHKLGDVTFHIPHGTYDGAPWKFTSSDGRFEMDFEPIIDRSAAMDLRILRSVQHQVFGHFTGYVILDGGRKFEIRRFLGFAEEVQNRW